MEARTRPIKTVGSPSCVAGRPIAAEEDHENKGQAGILGQLPIEVARELVAA